MKVITVTIMFGVLALSIVVSHSHAIDSNPNEQQRLELLGKVKAAFPISAYKKKLEKKKEILQAKFKNPDIVERIALERELALLQIKLDNYRQYYDETVKLLIEVFLALEHFQNDFSPDEYGSAQTALINGETELANQLLTNIDAKYRVTLGGDGIDRAASAVYIQGNIAEDQLDFQKAYRHYRKAVRYDPGNVRYLTAAGKIADSIALYGNAIVFYEAALAIQKKNKEIPRDEIRQLLIKLGKVWESKGDEQKANEYNQQASETNKRIK